MKCGICCVSYTFYVSILHDYYISELSLRADMTRFTPPRQSREVSIALKVTVGTLNFSHASISKAQQLESAPRPFLHFYKWCSPCCQQSQAPCWRHVQYIFRSLFVFFIIHTMENPAGERFVRTWGESSRIEEQSSLQTPRGINLHVVT